MMNLFHFMIGNLPWAQLLWVIHQTLKGRSSAVFGFLTLILRPVVSNVSMPIRKTKHKLIIELTAKAYGLFTR